MIILLNDVLLRGTIIYIHSEVPISETSNTCGNKVRNTLEIMDSDYKHNFAIFFFNIDVVYYTP